MSRRRPFISTAVLLNAICIFFAIQAQAWPGRLTEEFHHTYPLPADGRVELDNLNGDVHITAWDENQVKVDAVKYANTQERLNEMKIEIGSGSDYLSDRNAVSGPRPYI